MYQNHGLENEYKEYLLYLYDIAYAKYCDCTDIDNLVQETLMALFIKQKQGIAVEYPKGFLSAVLKNKHNEWLRHKYKNNIVSYETLETADDNDDFKKIEEALTQNEEYASVRREIGRLIKIYRDVTVRYYVRGQSVEKIAAELNISVGTVKSRLSTAREQIKEGLIKMEKYSELSYSPKYISIGIWGGAGLSGEPFSLIPSEIEQNILILAYETPVSIRGIADSMGIPSAFIEPIVEKLVNGELMGKTAGGLVYTRCFMVAYRDSFGDISAQESVAKKCAESVWQAANKHFAKLYENSEFLSMTEKQKATLCLMALDAALTQTATSCLFNDNMPSSPPERPNGGNWFAYGTVFENSERRNNLYEGSGPVHVSYSSDINQPSVCRMQDKQSLFGDTHWAYGRFKYNCSLRTIMRFYASLVPDCDVQPDDQRIYELVPEFEKLHIVKRATDGTAILDIPYLTEETAQEIYYPAINNIQNELLPLLREDLINECVSKKHRVPKHVDGYKHCEYQWLLRAYPLAQLVEIIKQNLFPYNVEIGKTPLIFLTYRKKV